MGWNEVIETIPPCLAELLKEGDRTVGLSKLCLRNDVVLGGVEADGSLGLKLSSHCCESLFVL